jgi:hypothetical protein
LPGPMAPSIGIDRCKSAIPPYACFSDISDLPFLIWFAGEFSDSASLPIYHGLWTAGRPTLQPRPSPGCESVPKAPAPRPGQACSNAVAYASTLLDPALCDPCFEMTERTDQPGNDRGYLSSRRRAYADRCNLAKSSESRALSTSLAARRTVTATRIRPGKSGMDQTSPCFCSRFRTSLA